MSILRFWPILFPSRLLSDEWKENIQNTHLSIYYIIFASVEFNYNTFLKAMGLFSFVPICILKGLHRG